MRDDDLVRRLVAAISTSPTKIKELVSTPLLATLLAISYRAAHRIPLDFSEFYEELFQILLVRHDGSKLGWRRQRNSKLNDREIQQIFEAFCFASRKKQTSAMDRDVTLNIASESIRECKSAVDPTDFLDDIRKITCLLVEEGKKTHFVHTSVQEFFASRYIKTRPESVAKKFYEQLLAGKWDKWKQEIEFLRQIDNHRISKYFLIPDLDLTIKHFLGEHKAVTQELVEKYLDSLSVRKKKVSREGVESDHYYVSITRPRATYSYAALDARLYATLFHTQEGTEKNWRVAFDQNPNIELRTYRQIAADKGTACAARASTLVTIAMNSSLRERQQLSSNITHDEREGSFMDIG